MTNAAEPQCRKASATEPYVSLGCEPRPPFPRAASVASVALPRAEAAGLSGSEEEVRAMWPRGVPSWIHSFWAVNPRFQPHLVGSSAAPSPGASVVPLLLGERRRSVLQAGLETLPGSRIEAQCSTPGVETGRLAPVPPCCGRLASMRPGEAPGLPRFLWGVETSGTAPGQASAFSQGAGQAGEDGGDKGSWPPPAHPTFTLSHARPNTFDGHSSWKAGFTARADTAEVKSKMQGSGGLRAGPGGQQAGGRGHPRARKTASSPVACAGPLVLSRAVCASGGAGWGACGSVLGFGLWLHVFLHPIWGRQRFR